MGENYQQIEEFELLKNHVKSMGGVWKLGAEYDQYIQRFCKEQKPRCPGCRERTTKFLFINNRKTARTLQPRYRCGGCNRTFTWR